MSLFGSRSVGSRKSFATSSLFSVLAFAGLASSGLTNAGQWSSEVGVELRYFPEAGQDGQDTFQLSVRGELEYEHMLDEGSFDVLLFGRADKEDSERSHVDIREASWTHVADDWELKAGISKVFWGVTESRHLVDVINQTDLVENIDGEDKLGQPMAKLSFERDWGTLDLFWLPYFRERTFAGDEGRLVPPFPVEQDRAEYESGAEEWRSDVALRYSHYVGDLEFALGHFSGTARDPELRVDVSSGSPKLIPYYSVIDQTSVELQYIYEEWLLKFEGITASGVEGGRYSAAVAGFEFTQYGIFESAADLGWIAEYLFDDRKSNAPHSFERDIFLGWRYAFNDEDSSEILLGAIYDPKTNEKLYSFEANQRLTNDLKVFFEVRAFEGASASDKSWFLRDEDHVQFELVKYF